MTGKQKCELLREIRKRLAEKNNIKIDLSECPHKKCRWGTCPRCDAELEELTEAIRKKKEAGEIISFGQEEIDIVELLTGVNLNDNFADDDSFVLTGEPEPLMGLIAANPDTFKAMTFSFRLLDMVSTLEEDEDKNIALSPYRIQAVLTLLANWSDDKLSKKICETIGNDVQNIDAANSLCGKDQLKFSPYKDLGNEFIPTIETQTLLWAKEGLKLNSDAIENVSDILEIGVKEIDFSKPETKDIINETVKKASHGLIKHIQAEIQPLMNVLITDILYFKAMWNRRFKKAETKERLFYGTSGKKIVQMMHAHYDMPYAENNKFQVVDLAYRCWSSPYKCFYMRIYLPKKGYDIEDVVNNILWQDGINLEMKMEDVKLSLPKFSIESNTDLKEVLKAMGLEDIFKSVSVVSKLVKNTYVDDITQQVKVIVDEECTEAAALTELSCLAGAPPTVIPEPVIMNVNRPFLFEIREENSNITLFSGLIRNIEE